MLKQEIDHDVIYEDMWEDKECEMLPYLKNGVLSTAFCYARFSKGMEETAGFGMKNSLPLPSLANKYLNSLRNETDEPIYIYNDENMCHLIEKIIRGDRSEASNRY